MALTDFDKELFDGKKGKTFYYRDDDGCIMVYDAYLNPFAFIKDKTLDDFGDDDEALLKATYDGMPK